MHSREWTYTHDVPVHMSPLPLWKTHNLTYFYRDSHSVTIYFLLQFNELISLNHIQYIRCIPSNVASAHLHFLTSLPSCHFFGIITYLHLLNVTVSCYIWCWKSVNCMPDFTHSFTHFLYTLVENFLLVGWFVCWWYRWWWRWLYISMVTCSNYLKLSFTYIFEKYWKYFTAIYGKILYEYCNKFIYGNISRKYIIYFAYRNLYVYKYKWIYNVGYFER